MCEESGHKGISQHLGDWGGLVVMHFGRQLAGIEGEGGLDGSVYDHGHVEVIDGRLESILGRACEVEGGSRLTDISYQAVGVRRGLARASTPGCCECRPGEYNYSFPLHGTFCPRPSRPSQASRSGHAEEALCPNPLA